jgi:hypothetical protein
VHRPGPHFSRPFTPTPDSAMTHLHRPALTLCALLTLTGCGVISMAGSVVGAAVDVTSTVVTTTVKLGSKAVGAGIDALSSDEAASAPTAASAAK